jgi:hypothetical protein
MSPPLHNPPHIDLPVDRFCLSLSPGHDCRPYAVRSVMDVVAPSSILRLESESEPRGRYTEQAMASHSFGHCIRAQCTDFTLDPPSTMSFPIYRLWKHSWQGISLAIAFIVYNELHLHSHWLTRNACNAWGYASFNAGASAIAGAYNSFHTVFSNDRMPCARTIDDDLAYFTLICRQCPHNFLDTPCPGFPR